MKKITVILADDHTVVRQGLRSLLAAEQDIEIVGEAENGRQTVQMVQKLRPDVVVMDIAMPQLNGLEATRQIMREGGGGNHCIGEAHPSVPAQNDRALNHSFIQL